MDEQHAWIKSRRKKRLRILASALSFCLLFTTYPDILETLSVLAAGTQDGDGTVYVSGFAGLPEEVREQTVPVGTGAESLTLPDMLEAVVVIPESEILPEDAEEETETPTEGAEGETEAPTEGAEGETETPTEGAEGETEAPTEGAEEETEAPTEGTEKETGSPETEGTDTDEKTADDTQPEQEADGENTAPDYGDNQTVESQGTEPETSEVAGDTESEEGQDTEPEKTVAETVATEEAAMQEKADNAGDSGESAPSVQTEDAEPKQETHTVTMPEYQAENVITVETLENTQETGVEEETVMIEGVAWQSAPEYDGNTEGIYIFTAVLPEGYALAEGVGLPQITVTVQADSADPVIQALLERIAALPDAEEYLAKEPDTEEEEAYAEWLEGLYQYAGEALDMQEAYDVLTGKQQAQIPEEAFTKLAAWAKIAEQIAGNSMVMAAETTANGTCGDNLTWTLDDVGTLTIAGSGDMENYTVYDDGKAPWNGHRQQITKVVIESGVTSIGNYAFQGCSLATVTIPDGVTRIGYDAFESCSALTTVIIPNSVTEIGEEAFKSCSALTAVTISDKVTYINRRTFSDCGALTTVTIPDSVTEIGEEAFKSCNALTAVTISDKVTYIGHAAFFFRNRNAVTEMTFQGTEIIPKLASVQSLPSMNIRIKIPSCRYLVAYSAGDGWGSFIKNIENKHTPEKVSAKAAKCDETGNTEHWKCNNEGCGLLFSDSEGTTTITEADVAIAQLGHRYTYTASGAAITHKCTTVGGCGYSATATLSLSETNHTYTGNEIKPAIVTCSDNWKGASLTPGYANNINAGTATASIAINNVTASLNFTIAPKSLNANMITFASDSHPYTGSAITPTVTVTDGGKTVADSNYTVSYSNNTNVGTATVTVKGKGNYTGTINKTFQIKASSISGATVTLSSTSFIYNGSAQIPGVSSVEVGSSTLIKGTDYTVSGSAGTDVGTYTITIKGIGGYAGSIKEVAFKIEPKSLTGSTVTVAPGPHYYTGNPVTPEVTVHDGGRDTDLEKGKDYTVSYEDNTGAGTSAKVTVAGTGNYSGTLSETFTIGYSPLPAGKSLTDYVTISPSPTDGWYGSDITLKPESGCRVGETPAGIGGSVTIPDETGTDGSKKTIYIKDSGGNIYETEFPYKLDKTPPEVNLTGMTVENGRKTLRDWITGRTSMIIRIPVSGVTDDLSGIAEVTYAAKPDTDNGTAQNGTLTEQDGYYEIALNAEFSGTIKLTAEDNAGNTTEVSLTADGGKVIAEDYAPIVTFALPDAPQPNENGWYNAAVKITVTVTDDKNSSSVDIISGGIAEIRWKDGENGEAQTVAGLPGASPVYNQTFTIDADSDGTHTYYVRAVDNAGNVSAGTDGWQSITVKVDTEKPEFTGNPTAKNPAKEGAYITFTPSEGGKAYWIVTDTGTAPTAQEVKEQSGQKGGVQDIEGGTEGSFTITGLNAGEKHTVHVVLEDAAGNLSEVKTESFLTLQKAPEITLEQLTVDYTKETIKLPDNFRDVEVYTDQQHPESSKIDKNPGDGSLPVKPGTPIYIRYPAKEDGSLTASDGVKIDIPDRPAVPAAKQAAVTDTTAAVTNPADGEEYVLVPRGHTPGQSDWSKANTTGQFAGLEPNQEYDLYVRKKAAEDSFASEPAKTAIRTHVAIKEPAITGDGAGKSGNTAPKPDAPDTGGTDTPGTVTFTGTYGEEYTPVIITDGGEILPGDGTAGSGMAWDEKTKKGTWEYTLTIPDGAKEAGITVEFRKRTLTGITVTPDTLTIYADDAANVSMEALNAYVKANSSARAVYDNKTSGAVQAAYATADSFAQKGGTYAYTASAEGKTDHITLTVKAVSAAVTAPDTWMQVHKSGGYTAAEVGGWLPAQVTVTYTGDGYTARTENRAAAWNTASTGPDFGAALGEKTITGTVGLPPWATGGNSVSMVIEFVDKIVLRDDQIQLNMPGFSYGAQTLPDPKGSITVADTNPTYTYLYSADGGANWVTADKLPKSDGGYLIPGGYMVKMAYTGDSYTGGKTASFTVEKKALAILPGTLEVQNKNYDGTANASLKEGGQPVLSGVAAGDTVTLGGSLSAVFTEAGPEKNIPVTVTGFTLEGRDAEYYTLHNAALTLYATINNADGTPPRGNSGNGGGDSSSGNGANSGGGDSNGGDGDSSGGDSSSEDGSNTEGSINGSGRPAAAKPVTSPADAAGQLSGTGGSSGRKSGTQKTPGTAEGDAETGDTDSPGSRPENGRAAGNTDPPEPGAEQNGTDTQGQDGADSAQTQNRQMGGTRPQTLQASLEDGRLTTAGDLVATGNIAEASETTTILEAGDGAVIVTVVCGDETCTAGVKDTAAVANAVLLPQQIELVKDGGTIEIRVDVKDISETVPGQDKEVIESGLAECRKEMPDMALGMYVDISMFIRVGEGGWNAVTRTEEPIEVVVGIPEELKADGRKFTIIRSHDGEYTLLPDLDDSPDTITVSTNMFSAYAIAYEQAGGSAECGLCHICPAFLGICCYIWLAVIVAIVLLIWIVIRRKWKQPPTKQLP